MCDETAVWRTTASGVPLLQAHFNMRRLHLRMLFLIRMFSSRVTPKGAAGQWHDDFASARSMITPFTASPSRSIPEFRGAACTRSDVNVYYLAWWIVKLNFKSNYSFKTNDELLALATNRQSLEYEAQSALRDELMRRSLADSHLRHGGSLGETPLRGQNLAFNTLAKIAALAMSIGLLALAFTYVVAVAQGHQLGIFLAACVLVWGPIFLVIAWATRRALRSRQAPRQFPRP